MTTIADEAGLNRVFQSIYRNDAFAFSAPQMAAITAPADSSHVIIAGAGSGKTTVMAARVVWMVGHLGVEPERVLGLTFTNKAAAELGARIGQALTAIEAEGEPTTGTYHAFAGSLIAEHGLRLGIEPDLQVTSDASRFQRVARALESYPGTLELVTTHLPSLIEQVMTLDGQLSEHLVTTEGLREFDAEVLTELAGCERQLNFHREAAVASRKRTELSRLVDVYRRAKADDSVMDFSDQMAWGAQLAMLPEVGESLRERFDMVLLDEYQDTSVAQRDLLQSLFSGPEGSGVRGVTAVGDPAQGIYGWRGAATGNLEDFLTDFPPAGGGRGGLHSLIESRRCASRIIDAANTLAADFYATSRVVRPLAAHPDNPAGRVDVALHHTIEGEIAAVIAGIQDAVEHHPLSEIAILVRIGGENSAIVAALREADIPFEVVGLNGLLAQPEVQDLLALLEVVSDVTANPATLRLLTNPRWRIGPRDLALLGRRASDLTGRAFGRPEGGTLEEELARSVEGTDPAEIVSLADAVEDPGHLPYSSEARQRFAELNTLLTQMRARAAEPLVDFARRAMYALDLDIELELSSAAGGLDNLSLLFDAIADYAETDRHASLAGLLAYLNAEENFNDGMEVSTPSEANSVKLLTVHRAKGLEWDVVFVPFMAKSVFPSGRGRPKWVTSASTLPIPLRGDRASLADIEEWSRQANEEFGALARRDALNEERRLGYVAYTRAKSRLSVSGHWWGRTQDNPRGPSEFLLNTRDWLAGHGVQPLHWDAGPQEGDTNPHADESVHASWPASPPELGRRQTLADAVRAHHRDAPAPLLDVTDVKNDETERAEMASAEMECLDGIERDLELLVAESAEDASTQVVSLPAGLSATTALRLARDEEGLLAELARPMPRRPAPAARFGTQFHAWVETHFGQQSLLDPADLPGQGDVGIADDAELRDLTRAFKEGPYGESQPFAIEAPFRLMLGGQQIIGRIDAVYKTEHGFEVVDWKTNKAADADELQLALYRLAWAELQGIDVEHVTGAFYYVRLGEVHRFTDLPGREQLERLLGFGQPPSV